MSKFKGTKGKWYRDTKSSIVSSVYSENGEKLIHISGRNNEEAKANALLISKAPELLETVTDLLNELAYHGYTHSTAINNARELIKSATEG